MKKRTFLVITLAMLVLLIGCLAWYRNKSTHLYGNDQDSIVKVIHAIHGYEDAAIEILEVRDFDDQRVVGFLSNHRPGCIQFRKNSDGDFDWSFIQVRNNETFSYFIPDHLPMFMLVASPENEIAKIQVRINGQKLEQHVIPHKAAVAWIDFPESEDHHYEFRDYTYYDKDGNLMKELN
ncbi:hypothetical protein [Paenibacillus hexagrammi]|uniref:Lipoprotein n=1 Tax=Paenibacillus hexagrammi TaxID=2908839 RepID=A0ABY3SIV6_9BACL|nr:hypothetical protein [Paenibacillus sp. YPD9-1]UJF33455.1 hypothetical protein L0M14_28795 [Paenibacillus sp. YPD9-1]